MGATSPRLVLGLLDLSVLSAAALPAQWAPDQQGAYMASEGVDTPMSERDFDRPERRLSEWGFADGEFLEAVVQRLRHPKNQPAVTVVQTMSMHSPFVVPEQAHCRRLVDAGLDTLGLGAEQRTEVLHQRDVYGSVIYTDAMLRRFFEDMAQLPSWRNTVVVITGGHRLPEILMVQKLERYPFPLLVASPLRRQPLQVKAVSSHFDVAPSILALLSYRYGWATPATVTWMGTGLDTASEFRNLHALPLQQTKTELSHYVSGLNYSAQDRLYRIGDGLEPETMDNPALQARLREARNGARPTAWPPSWPRGKAPWCVCNWCCDPRRWRTGRCLSRWWCRTRTPATYRTRPIPCARAPAYRNEALAMFQRVLDTTRRPAKLARFDGINLNIEPHILDEWDTQRTALLTQFIDLSHAFMAIKRRANASLQVGPAIPF